MKTDKLGKFGLRLKELRLEHGKTQKFMGELLSCTVSNYQKMEYGDVNISLLDLLLLADYFDVSLDYLVGRSEIREKQ